MYIFVATKREVDGKRIERKKIDKTGERKKNREKDKSLLEIESLPEPQKRLHNRNHIGALALTWFVLRWLLCRTVLYSLSCSRCLQHNLSVSLCYKMRLFRLPPLILLFASNSSVRAANDMF